MHQCAWNGDLLLLRLCVQKGAKVGLRTKDQRIPAQMAATRGHFDVVQYLDSQSCDLKSLCRLSISEAMGKRRYNRINELPLPPTVKLFLNYNIPYSGFEATLIPPEPWTVKELHSRSVTADEIQQFIRENASQEFLEEHRDVVGEPQSEEASAAVNYKQTCSGARGSAKNNLEELIDVFQSMYLWEAFKSVKFEEPLARKPRYSMQKLEKKDSKLKATRMGFNYGLYLKYLGLSED